MGFSSISMVAHEFKREPNDKYYISYISEPQQHKTCTIPTPDTHVLKRMC